MKDETLALLVLGPSHGTQVMLSGRPEEYLVASQSDLMGMLHHRQDALVTEMTMTVHVYRRTSPCVFPKNIGAYVYEYAGPHTR